MFINEFGLSILNKKQRKKDGQGMYLLDVQKDRKGGFVIKMIINLSLMKQELI